MKRTEIKELKIVGRQHSLLLGKAICNQFPDYRLLAWGRTEHSLSPGREGCSSEACPLAFCPSKDMKTVVYQLPRVKKCIVNVALL